MSKRAMEQLVELGRGSAERVKERERQLASPASRSRREESRTAHLGASNKAASQLVDREFGTLLAPSRAEGGIESLAGGRRVAKFVDDRTVVLAGDGDRPPVLVDSPSPLRTTDDDGRKRVVDLTLVRSEDGFEPTNMAADVRLPDALAEGVQVGPVSVVPGGSATGSLVDGRSDSVIYPNAQVDTDVVVAPRAMGAEIFWQLRSPRASEELTLDLELPDGALVQATDAGSAVVEKDNEPLATISAPTAVDAQGRDVPVKMAAPDGRLVLSIAHRDADVAYPILVDPVVEDHFSNPQNGAIWMHQDPVALSRLGEWDLGFGGGAVYGQYIQRHHCYVPVSCYSANPNVADGLHIYGQHTTVSYPAGSWAQFVYEPPGSTTQVDWADMYAIYDRRGINQHPNMFTGIYSASAGWVSLEHDVYDWAGWIEHDANTTAPGRRSAVFGMYSPYNVTNNNWNDSYLGHVVLGLTDPEPPTINGGQVQRYDVPDGETEGQWNAVTHPARWVKRQDRLRFHPTVSDPGLGVADVQITGTGVNNGFGLDCTGTKISPCPSAWPGAQGLEFDAEGMPDGANTLTIKAWDALGQQSTQGTTINVDNTQPAIATPTGSLWQNKEEDNLLPEQQAVLTPGIHPVSFTASDVNAGVELLEVRVDGQVESNQTRVQCSSGGCQRSLTWNYDTAKFGGRHRIELVAYDGADNAKRTSFYVNAPSTGDLIYPVDGEITSRKIALQAKDNNDDFTAVRFEYRKRPMGTWTTIASHLVDDQGTPVSGSSHGLLEPGRRSKKLIWDVGAVLGALVPKATKIQVRAVFTGAPQEFGSRVSDVDLDDKGISADNAQEPIGPGSVDLLTGNFSLSATDASLSTFGTPISVTRTFNSLDPNANPNGPFGPGWVMSAPMDGVSGYSYLQVLNDPSMRDWVDVFDSAGARIRFEKTGATSFKSQVGFESLTLTRVETSGQSDKYTIVDLEEATTTFIKQGTSKFVPSKVEQADSQGTASYNYQLYMGEPRLKRVVAPSAPSQNCDHLGWPATALPTGCRVLEFEYSTFTAFGQSRLREINQIAFNGSGMSSVTVASFGYHSGEHAGRLKEVTDPRVSHSIKTVYGYTGADHRISELTPPGEAAWNIGYVAGPDGAMRLDSVSRTATDSGLESWRMRYEVPLSIAAGGPYDLTAGVLAAWGQTELPTDATAILPPTETGNGYSKATVRYLNQDGRPVNTALPGGRISATEYDVWGNAIRELSATNRARAVVYPGNVQAKADYSRTVDTQRTFESRGLRLSEELGPEHQVKLDSGQVADARLFTTTEYDEPNSDASTPAKPVHLPTTVTAGAKVGSDPLVDVRTTRTEYDWTLRKPIKVTLDPGSGNLNIVSRTSYNSAGLEVESRQPKSGGSDAGTTKTIYYGDSSDPDCSGHIEWFNLPCKTKPAAQPGVAGLPDLPVTTYTYNRYGQVTTATERVDDVSRTVTTSYDAAGRATSESVSTSSSEPDPGVPEGLVAAYGFEEGVGSVVGDSSNNGNVGAVHGAAWTAAGKFGNALDFDGAADWVKVPQSASLNSPQAVTVSAWVKPEEISGLWQTVALKEDPITGFSYGLYADTYLLTPFMGMASGWHFGEIYGTSPLQDDEWAHVAGVFGSQTIKLYVDGQLAGSAPTTASSLDTSTGPLYIGAGPEVEEFNGLIDEVRVYDRVLSQQEIQTDMDNSLAEQTSIVDHAIPTTTYAYSPTTGRPTTVSTPGATLTTGYDNVGRVTSYTDADGATSTTSYDSSNRPITTTDGKGSQTRTYDAATGLLTSLEDSDAGTFTASYGEDGQMLSKTYPNGMKADTTYDPAGAPIALKYTKTSNCSANCVWIDEQVSESIHGQWRTHDWELSSQEYAYDKAGRLTRVEDDVESPAPVAGCTIRSYSFDANSNRTSMNTKGPAGNGDCQPGVAGTSKAYAYDDADRLTGTGIEYDNFGRMASIPAQHSGGGVLDYTYYVNDQVRTIAQDGVSKTYALDPMGRQHRTVATGGTTHTETLHYQDGSDSPSWTSVANTQGVETSWERNIEGIDGDLAAIRTYDAQGDTTVLQLQNLHGDIVATASTDPNATVLTARFESDEFGNPRQQTGRRYGWLGAEQRRTELASGVIQMGARSYVPGLGRFTSVDPIKGGSASDYDYANQDPLNMLDLDGQFSIPRALKGVKNWAKKAVKRVGHRAAPSQIKLMVLSARFASTVVNARIRKATQRLGTGRVGRCVAGAANHFTKRGPGGMYTGLPLAIFGCIRGVKGKF